MIDITLAYHSVYYKLIANLTSNLTLMISSNLHPHQSAMIDSLRLVERNSTPRRRQVRSNPHCFPNYNDPDIS